MESRMNNVRTFPVANVLTDDTIDFNHYMRESDPQSKVRPAAEYLDQVMHLLSPATAERSKARLPFGSSYLEFRPGEVTAWAGFNGSGKSMLQGQIMAHLCAVGERACIASFEMKPERTLQRIVRQSLGKADPRKHEVVTLLDSWADHLWLYDQQGSVIPDRILAVIRYCAQELRIGHIAIDSLMKCVKGEDDYNGQKDFVNALTTAARDYGTHIHLVHHLRKGDGDDRLPTRMDMRGSSAISDHVDNVLLVWRNKPKERNRDAGKPVDQTDPDAVLICDKQRNGEWEGRQKLWYRKDTMQFTDSQHGA